MIWELLRLFPGFVLWNWYSDKRGFQQLPVDDHYPRSWRPLLGKAVNSSGLLHTIALAIRQEVEGMSLYGVLVVFCGLILVIATFISHTVAALIILPIVAQVGAGMDEPHPNLLVMGAALMCSAAMGLPTSGFPNMSTFYSLSLNHCDLIRVCAFTNNVCSGDHDGRLTDWAKIFTCSTFHQ